MIRRVFAIEPNQRVFLAIGIDKREDDREIEPRDRIVANVYPELTAARTFDIIRPMPVCLSFPQPWLKSCLPVFR